MFSSDLPERKRSGYEKDEKYQGEDCEEGASQGRSLFDVVSAYTLGDRYATAALNPPHSTTCNHSVTATENRMDLSSWMWKVQNVLGYCTKNAASDMSVFS